MKRVNHFVFTNAAKCFQVMEVPDMIFLVSVGVSPPRPKMGLAEYIEEESIYVRSFIIKFRKMTAANDQKRPFVN